jgi:hypothetical protein
MAHDFSFFFHSKFSQNPKNIIKVIKNSELRKTCPIIFDLENHPGPENSSFHLY